MMTYVEELKQLWTDLDHLDPLVLAHSECVVAAKKLIEGRRVLKFLKGLDRNFENRRASLMHQAQLPSLEAAIAAITQEETRLKCNEKGGFTQRPALSAPKCESGEREWERRAPGEREKGRCVCGMNKFCLNFLFLYSSL